MKRRDELIKMTPTEFGQHIRGLYERNEIVPSRLQHLDHKLEHGCALGVSMFDAFRDCFGCKPDGPYEANFHGRRLLGLDTLDGQWELGVMCGFDNSSSFCTSDLSDPEHVHGMECGKEAWKAAEGLIANDN